MSNLQKIAQLFDPDNQRSKLEEGKKISKKHLINTLNYINFQDGTIFVNFKNLKYGNIISLQAKPKPCVGNNLDCYWVSKTGLSQKINLYKFINFILNDGMKLILVKPEVKKITEEGISFDLPEICYEVSSRKVKRHPCEGIKVEFIQNGVVFHGILLEFSAVSFSVKVSAEPPQSFQWVNPEHPVYVIFKNDQETLYSGECRIIRQTFNKKTRIFVLKPIKNNIIRFNPKEIRSSRHKLMPSPNVFFRHPFTNKMITLEVDDLSGSGFSVEEYYDSSVLLPGMIIPELYLEFANNFMIRCKVQVVYSNVYKTDEKRAFVKCGMAILDIDIQDQVKISSFLHQLTNRKSYVCNVVDLEALWKFFFESGFIYPEKYTFIHASKEKFKETYMKLYVQNPTIARHFIYQDKGIIYSHISMLRFYENTWLFHHHAANRSEFNRAGLVVLNQIGRYVNDFYRLYSTRMNFIICYFRPDNKFPNRVFGGFTKYLDNPKGCSHDIFAYLHFLRAFDQFDQKTFSGAWSLEKTQPDDLVELSGFYEYISGGLMLNALDLEPDMIDSDELSKEYQKLGFKRERHLFSLKRDGLLKAIFLVTISDVGLNMSSLTNCIHVIILDSEGLPHNILFSGLSQLSKYYEQDEIPILLYPVKDIEAKSISSDKIYNLWVLNVPVAGEHYLKYMEDLITHNKLE
ncbi:MAG: PilZ domain-containing protein [Acidobacteriota bacterium]